MWKKINFFDTTFTFSQVEQVFYVYLKCFIKHQISVQKNIIVNQMNSKFQTNQILPETEQQESTKENRTFIYEPFNISYVNTSQIHYSRNEQDRDVKVNNFLCYQEGNNLIKVTQICYEDKIVRIEDRFQVKMMNSKVEKVDSIETKGKVAKSSDKVRIFYQDSLGKIQKNGKAERKDKKNIVKNIIKIFLSWIQRKKMEKGPKQYEKIESEMKKLLSAENFNNRLIKNIISHEDINSSFLQFLLDDATEEVRYSRIHDKQSHFQAIELYKKLLDNPYQQNKEEIFNTKRFQKFQDEGIFPSLQVKEERYEQMEEQ